jgi:hypothetical protein
MPVFRQLLAAKRPGIRTFDIETEKGLVTMEDEKQTLLQLRLSKLQVIRTIRPRQGDPDISIQGALDFERGNLFTFKTGDQPTFEKNSEIGFFSISAAPEDKLVFQVDHKPSLTGTITADDFAVLVGAIEYAQAGLNGSIHIVFDEKIATDRAHFSLQRDGELSYLVEVGAVVDVAGIEKIAIATPI